MTNPAYFYRIKQAFFFIPLFLFALLLRGQTVCYTTQNAHSHNDYEQKIPFRMAYDQAFGSIEAQIYFSRDSELIVAHDEKEIQYNRSLGNSILKISIPVYEKTPSYPYKDSSRWLQLLIDIKTDSIETLGKLILLLEQFPSIIHNRHIYLVITGNRPNPDSFSHYPDYIWFDGVLSRFYSKDQLSRIKMLSDNFKYYSQWDGIGRCRLKTLKKSDPGLRRPIKMVFVFVSGTPRISVNAWSLSSYNCRLII